MDLGATKDVGPRMSPAGDHADELFGDLTHRTEPVSYLVPKDLLQQWKIHPEAVPP